MYTDMRCQQKGTCLYRAKRERYSWITYIELPHHFALFQGVNIVGLRQCFSEGAIGRGCVQRHGILLARTLIFGAGVHRG